MAGERAGHSPALATEDERLHLYEGMTAQTERGAEEGRHRSWSTSREGESSDLCGKPIRQPNIGSSFVDLVSPEDELRTRAGQPYGGAQPAQEGGSTGWDRRNEAPRSRPPQRALRRADRWLLARATDRPT